MATAADSPRTSSDAEIRSLPLPPGPRYATPFGFLREFRKDSIGYLTSLQREFGDVLCIRMGPLRSCVVSRPEHVHQVLVANHRKYGKGNLFAKLKVVAGDGLLFSEGERWRKQRRWVQPAFQRSHVNGVVPEMSRVMDATLERWSRERIHSEFDLLPEMSRLALDMVCRAMFGSTSPDPSFHDRVDEGIEFANYLLGSFLTPPLWVPTSRNRNARRTIHGIEEAIRKMISEARARTGGEADLLGLLLDARDEETGSPPSERELIDQMITLLVAGHETTAMALCWSFHLLGQHPEATHRLREEADTVLTGDVATAEDVMRLGFANRVVKESMRLFPPVWALPRQAEVDDEMAGYRIPRKAMVTLSPWIIHRHPDVWEDPERFDPDRFLPERSKGRHRLAFFPFGAGGRSCVGEDFAMLEATLALAMALRRFDVAPVAGHPVEPDPILTLRPRYGLQVRLTPR